MFGPGGYAYIYFIYGMYYCFNIVTEEEGFGAAVLVRGVEPVTGKEIIKENSPKPAKKYTNGPGKFCRAFGLTKDLNGTDLSGNKLYIIKRNDREVNIKSSKRIGLTNGVNRMWRFFDADSDCLSRR
jgi:DNA-3-methyladenine glycosylase